MRVSTPLLRPSSAGLARGDAAAGEGTGIRTPTDPEIETHLELEAELPPVSGEDAGPEPDLGLGGEPDDEHESVSITIEEGSTRVIETVTDDDAQTLTLTVTESSAAKPPRRRAITSQGGGAVSGTIDDSPEPPRRAKRQSEGYED